MVFEYPIAPPRLLLALRLQSAVFKAKPQLLYYSWINFHVFAHLHVLVYEMINPFVPIMRSLAVSLFVAKRLRGGYLKTWKRSLRGV